MAHQTLYTLTNISPLASIKLTTLYPHFSQTYSPSSPLQSQKYRNFHCGGNSSPHISPPTTLTNPYPSTAHPPGWSPPIYIKLTRPYYNSLPLHTIPPIDISNKSPCGREFHPISQT